MPVEELQLRNNAGVYEYTHRDTRHCEIDKRALGHCNSRILDPGFRSKESNDNYFT